MSFLHALPTVRLSASGRRLELKSAAQAVYASISETASSERGSPVLRRGCAGRCRHSTCGTYRPRGGSGSRCDRRIPRRCGTRYAPRDRPLQLHGLAYNLGNFMRTLAMPQAAEPWSLISLREKLIKIGAKVVSHGRYVTFKMAEVAVSRLMFTDILMLTARLRAPPAPG